MGNSDTIRQRLLSGDRPNTVRITMASTVDEVKAVCESGAEMIYVDTQHEPYTEWDLVRICRAAEPYDVPVQLRIKHLRQCYLIGGLADLGAFCFKVPEVRKVETVQEAVDAFYYPPMGSRSWGGKGFRMAEMKENPRVYADWWNEHAILGFKIESVEAVLNIRDLCLPGIHYVDFGPSDLQIDLDVVQHPYLKTYADCVAFVKRELEGTQVAVLA